MNTQPALLLAWALGPRAQKGRSGSAQSLELSHRTVSTAFAGGAVLTCALRVTAAACGKTQAGPWLCPVAQQQGRCRPPPETPERAHGCCSCREGREGRRPWPAASTQAHGRRPASAGPRSANQVARNSWGAGGWRRPPWERCSRALGRGRPHPPARGRAQGHPRVCAGRVPLAEAGSVSSTDRSQRESRS